MESRGRPPVDLQRTAIFQSWKPAPLEEVAWVTDSLWWSDRFGLGSWATGQDGETVSLIFFCPGCGELTSCGVRKHDNHPVWTWDGNRATPTLSPSILHTPGKGGCGWHGYLRAGRFVLG